MSEKRWMCWPNPDQSCVDGECEYCVPDPYLLKWFKRIVMRHHRRMTHEQIATYAEQQGMRA